MTSPRRRVAPAALALALALPTVAIGQPADEDLAAQIEELRKGQQEIRKQLAEIQKALEARQAPARPSGPDVVGKSFDLGSNPIKGASSAPLTLVEFTDYQ